jgi:hypothetical protein
MKEFEAMEDFKKTINNADDAKIEEIYKDTAKEYESNKSSDQESVENDSSNSSDRQSTGEKSDGEKSNLQTQSSKNSATPSAPSVKPTSINS